MAKRQAPKKAARPTRPKKKATTRRRPIEEARIKKAKAAWLATYRGGGTREEAAKKAGVSRRTFYRWLELDEEFRREVDDAKEESTERLEDEAFRRAMAGSDTMLIFKLKARRPEIYRERYDVNATMGGKLDVTQHEVVDLAGPAIRRMGTEKLEQARTLLRELLDAKE